jgi:hypothetical protein
LLLTLDLLLNFIKELVAQCRLIDDQFDVFFHLSMELLDVAAALGHLHGLRSFKFIEVIYVWLRWLHCVKVVLLKVVVAKRAAELYFDTLACV